MWIFTEAADWFDKIRLGNNQFLDDTFQGWSNYVDKHNADPGFFPAVRNIAIMWGGVGPLYALNQFTSTVASGFIDTLRIGDGIKAGGWGYGQDALRLLMFAPFLRVARLGFLKVFSVDPGGGICTWVAVKNALGLTGTQHFITLGKVLDYAGIELADAAKVKGVFLEEIVDLLKILGADVQTVQPTGTVLEGLASALGDGVGRTAIFSVRWNTLMSGTAQEVGHTLVAYRSSLTGVIQILDRSNKVVRSLSELESIYSNAPGISNAVFYTGANSPIVLLSNSAVTTILDNGASISTSARSVQAWIVNELGDKMESNARWIHDAVGVEVRSVPFRVETRSSIQAPIRPAEAKGKVVTQTICAPNVGNADTGSQADSCAVFKTYTVKAGDTLSAIAKLAYGDPERWNGIAAANKISDPNVLKEGKVLVIP